MISCGECDRISRDQCANCGSPICADHIYGATIDGDIVCENCYESHLVDDLEGEAKEEEKLI